MKCRICEDTGWEDLIPQPVRCDACNYWEECEHSEWIFVALKNDFYCKQCGIRGDE